MKDRLSRIGPQQREQHYYLRPEHRCYYWGEYTPWEYTQGAGADYSEMNRLIAALKTPVLETNPDAIAAKEAAIDRIAQAFATFWKWADLASKAVLVPMPPSRPASDPAYDDRMLRVLNRIRDIAGVKLKIVAALHHDGQLPASHTASKRPSRSTLARKMRVDASAFGGTICEYAFLFDDVVTTGAHFVAAANALAQATPGAKVIGNFVARTARPTS